jgi:hypothetical protein
MVTEAQLFGNGSTSATLYTSGVPKVLRKVEYLCKFKRFFDETWWNSHSTFHYLIPKRASKNIEGNITF